MFHHAVLKKFELGENGTKDGHDILVPSTVEAFQWQCGSSTKSAHFGVHAAEYGHENAPAQLKARIGGETKCDIGCDSCESRDYHAVAVGAHHISSVFIRPT